MRRSKTESLGFDRESSITERRTGLTFQLNEIFRQTLVGPDSHSRHVRNEIAIGEDEFRSENFSTNLETLIQVRLIAIRDTEISIAEEVFELVGHGEDHRITRQSFREHHCRTDLIVNESPAQIPEPVGPLVYFDSVFCINPHQVAGEHAW